MVTDIKIQNLQNLWNFVSQKLLTTTLEGGFKPQIKSFLILAKACNELAGPVSTSLRLRATQLLSKCRSGGEPLGTLSNLTRVRIELQISGFREECAAARPTNQRFKP